MRTFYLGTHRASWLGTVPEPLFIAYQQLVGRRDLRPALAPWVLDSGGFSMLSRCAWTLRLRGPYPMTVAEYARDVERLRDEVGLLDWVAPMDYMCEPSLVYWHALGVAEHQRRTTENLLRLRDHVGSLAAPVLQGWRIDDYLRHAEAYERAGVDLAAERIVGVGSVCRRGENDEIVRVLDRVAREGLRLHAFGVRTRALERIRDAVESADSLAWSFRARRGKIVLPEHEGRHASCANCVEYAVAWRDHHASPALRLGVYS